MTKFPCKDCPDRKPACHSTCDRYNKARAEHEQLNARIRADKEARAYEGRKFGEIFDERIRRKKRQARYGLKKDRR